MKQAKDWLQIKSNSGGDGRTATKSKVVDCCCPWSAGGSQTNGKDHNLQTNMSENNNTNSLKKPINSHGTGKRRTVVNQSLTYNHNDIVTTPHQHHGDPQGQKCAVTRPYPRGPRLDTH